MNKKHILFVDDEPNVLQGLQRMLRPLRQEWEVETAESGEKALEILGHSAFDVIVSDMRMPGMDGAQLLTEVMARYPQIIRIVLSGQSDQETIFRSVGPTHQYLSKPCDAETLKNTVDRACSLQALLSNAALKKLTSQMQSLPSLPTLYAEVLKELHSAEPSIERIGRIIAKDPGMTAKLLQLVNSAFFGFYRQVTDVSRAVTILGLDKIRSLVLSIHIFSTLDQTHLQKFDLAALWKHNLMVGQGSKIILQSLVSDKVVLEGAYMAGLLHDTGKLILMANCPQEYTQVLQQAKNASQSTAEIERSHFGSSHAELGAYLLGLWGLPTHIVEAVAFHHLPNMAGSMIISPLTAVHLADILQREIKPIEFENTMPLDQAYLEALGLMDKIPAWRNAMETLLAKDEDP